MASLRIFLALVVVSILLYRYVVYPVLRSPLAKIPQAHLTASFSPIWMLWRRYQCREVQTIHQAHQKLGPVVKLGPRELSVSCVDGGVRTIYGGNFEKHEFYPNLFTANSGVAVLFSEVESKQHARRRRLISNIYSKSTLQNSPTMAKISSNIIRKRLMPTIQTAVRANGEVELFYLIVAITMDFITAYQFGQCNGSDFIRNAEGAFWWIDEFDKTKEGFFWPQELPKITTVLSKLGVHMVPKSVGKSASILEAWCLSMMENADANEDKFGEIVKSEDVPVHYAKLKAGFHSEDSWPDAKIAANHAREAWRTMAAAELLDNIGGAQEGTTTALFYVLRQLARNPTIQASLRAELLALSAPAVYASMDAALPSPKDIDSLVLLDAVITETLRLFPPMAGPQPRVTPPNATIGSYTGLPAGVRVSSQPFSLHRNAAVFPEPESWMPQRWISATASKKAEMMNWFWGFSSGSMMCIGSHFAVQQMKLVTASIVSNYYLSIVEDDDTDQVDAYSAQPAKKRLVLKFTNAT